MKTNNRRVRFYIAGKYSAPTVSGRVNNIKKAADLAKIIWQANYFCLCPHLNTAYFDNVLPYEDFIERYLESLEFCDVLVLMNNYKESPGALQELNRALQLGKMVIRETEIETFLNQLKEKDSGQSKQYYPPLTLSSPKEK